VLESIGRGFATTALVLEAAKPWKKTEFEGILLHGTGPCERCTIHFSSANFSVLNEKCSIVGGKVDGSLTFPPGINKFNCPHCGHRARVQLPMLFDRATRNQVIYGIPSIPGAAEDATMHVYRPIMNSLRSLLAICPML
jgi:hypothetical protein